MPLSARMQCMHAGLNEYKKHGLPVRTAGILKYRMIIWRPQGRDRAELMVTNVTIRLMLRWKQVYSTSDCATKICSYFDRVPSLVMG